jgi:hypothetical protein
VITEIDLHGLRDYSENPQVNCQILTDDFHLDIAVHVEIFEKFYVCHVVVFNRRKNLTWRLWRTNLICRYFNARKNPGLVHTDRVRLVNLRFCRPYPGLRFRSGRMHRGHIQPCRNYCLTFHTCGCRPALVACSLFHNGGRYMNKIIKTGTIITTSSCKYKILGYHPASDYYICDIFNLSGALIGHYQREPGDLLRAYHIKSSK